MTNVLETLIFASERAACVAKSCCSETLLVSQKCGKEANTRFDRDFKTIADVLAQAAAKAIIIDRHPDLTNYVRGEESLEIGGKTIELKETSDNTAEQLSSLLPPATATQMAKAAHGEIPNHGATVILPADIPTINCRDIGVWIDPIDATAEFIAGVCGEAKPGHGLECVTVLIGAYLRSTGEPVIGVINQPFFNGGKGRILWGLNKDGFKTFGGSNIETCSSSNTVLMSSAESPELAEKIKESGWELESVPGAGNKLLKVALDEAAAYVLSRGSTFRWDTCAPHAILRAKGGDLISYSTWKPITYNDPMGVDTQQYCNSEGIIAYNNPEVFQKLEKILV